MLEQAGVVDAGGTGYLLFFDALLTVVDGRAMPSPPELPDAAVRSGQSRVARCRRRPPPPARSADAELAGLRYEVMYLLEAPDETIPSFKEVWAGLGTPSWWSAATACGTATSTPTTSAPPSRRRSTPGGPGPSGSPTCSSRSKRSAGCARGRAPLGSGPSETPPGPAPATGVVAVATGDGIGRIFRSLGVQGLIAGGQSMNPSTAELVDAVDAVRSDEVIILPNNGNIRPVAERVDDLTAKSVWVVPTETIAEGFAALLAYDPEAGR